MYDHFDSEEAIARVKQAIEDHCPSFIANFGVPPLVINGKPAYPDPKHVGAKLIVNAFENPVAWFGATDEEALLKEALDALWAFEDAWAKLNSHSKSSLTRATISKLANASPNVENDDRIKSSTTYFLESARGPYIESVSFLDASIENLEIVKEVLTELHKEEVGKFGLGKRGINEAASVADACRQIWSYEKPVGEKPARYINPEKAETNKMNSFIEQVFEAFPFVITPASALKRLSKIKNAGVVKKG